MSNADRADRAQFALASYADHQDADALEEGFETLLRDLLADLMHFCEREDINFYHNHEIAIMNFVEELKEETDG